MPIWLRNFTFNSIREHYEKVKEEQDQWNKSTSAEKPKINRPDIDPTYKTRASSK
jgi:hypothetical protein